MPTVSVLINCYNYGRYVVEAIDSALQQTVPPDEIIVIDDGSTDDTPEVLACYEGHAVVKTFRQRNSGHMAAFVAGMERGTGDFLFFLDADDRYEPTHIENILNAFASNRDIGMVYTAHQHFGDSEEVVQYAPVDVDLGFSTIAALKDHIYIGSITSTLAIRRNVSLTILPVLRHIEPRWRMRADDCIVYGASMAAARKYYLATPTARYRFHAQNEHRFGAMTFHDEAYLHSLRRDTFFELLATHLGLGSTIRLNVVQEFLSIKQPTRSQYRVYRRLNGRFHTSLKQELKGSIKMFLHYRRNRPAWDVTTPAKFDA